jgi:hypothetical protein
MTDDNQLGLVRTNHCPNCEALSAENERLREAMENAVQEIDEGWSLNARDILEAALGETK